MGGDNAPICVTGANGFIAGWIVEQLLLDGHTVHATVRDPKDRKNDFLRVLAARLGATERLRLFGADLLARGAFDEAVRGCRVVIHTACVVAFAFKRDPFAEIINPAVDGVRNVVAACLEHGVERIVYTSSVATIACHEDFRPLDQKGKPFTEDMWLTHVTPTYGTYNYAKIAAERVLYEMWGDRPLTCILPSWTVGPLQNSAVNVTMAPVRLIASRGSRVLPLQFFDMVDVRDVARAHVFAATRTEPLPNGRYNVTGNRNSRIDTIAQMIHASFPTLDVTTRVAPYWLMWLKSFTDWRITAQMLSERTSQWAPIDNHKIQHAGFRFEHSSLVATLRDAVQSLFDQGVISPPRVE